MFFCCKGWLFPKEVVPNLFGWSVNSGRGSPNKENASKTPPPLNGKSHEKLPFFGNLFPRLVYPAGCHSWKNAQTVQTRLCNFQACCAIFLPVDAQVLFFILLWGWHKRSMNKRPVSLRDGRTCVLMVVHTILRQISNSCSCAFHSRELSVCAIFLRFFQLCRFVHTFNFYCISCCRAPLSHWSDLSLMSSQTTS